MNIEINVSGKFKRLTVVINDSKVYAEIYYPPDMLSKFVSKYPYYNRRFVITKNRAVEFISKQINKKELEKLRKIDAIATKLNTMAMQSYDNKFEKIAQELKKVINN